jgi:hypothetical protein
MMNRQQIENPSFLQYCPDVTQTFNGKKDSGLSKPFGVNEGRFRSIDHGIPGAGTYKLDDSC